MPMHELPHYRVSWHRNLADIDDGILTRPGAGGQGHPQAPQDRWAALDRRVQRARPRGRLVVGADARQPRGHGGPVRHRPDRHRAPGGQPALLRPHRAPGPRATLPEAQGVGGGWHDPPAAQPVPRDRHDDPGRHAGRGDVQRRLDRRARRAHRAAGGRRRAAAGRGRGPQGVRTTSSPPRSRSSRPPPRTVARSRRRRSASSHRSIRSSGIGGCSAPCGTSTTCGRSTCRRRSGSGATTSCRSCSAIGSSAASSRGSTARRRR